MVDKVHINRVLSCLKDGQQLMLTIVKGTGTKHRGELRTVHVIHGFAYEALQQKKTLAEMPRRAAGKYALAAIVPCVDVHSKQQLSIKIFNIIGCDGLKVMH